MNITLAGHGGGYPGFSTPWYYIPETDTCISLNVNIIGNLSAVTREILSPLAVYANR